MTIMRLLHTVKHLRSRQIAGQLAHRSRKLWDNPARVLKWEVPPFPGCVWNPREPFLPPLQNQPDGFDQAGRLEFLNQSITIGWPPDWNRTDLSMLWGFNLQYCDYLWALNYDAAAALVLDWIDRHRPSRGRIGWEPYPTSLRLVNWCAVFLGRHRERIERDPALAVRLWQSIYRQAQWLDLHRETRLMGNHLLENAVALTVVGSCFGGSAALRWYRHGLRLLEEQIPEQILPDGGHFERSPMYHSRAVYLLRLLAGIGRRELDRLVNEPLLRARQALKAMCHPDGRIALLNDSALGICNEPAELLANGADAGPAVDGVFALPDSGYYGTRTAEGCYVICDAGAIGPDYQPGHAHGDTLSFELSLLGDRVIVDSGVYGYETSDLRQYCRSTRAHNTVEVDGADQCEFWGAFRVARRARVHDVKWWPREDGFELSAWHDGYARLAGRPMHRRAFQWRNSGLLLLSDSLTSTAASRFVSRIHLHPDCRIEQVADNRAEVAFAAGRFTIEFAGEGRLDVEDSIYCPQFGRQIANQALAWSGTVAQRAAWTTRIELCRP